MDLSQNEAYRDFDFDETIGEASSQAHQSALNKTQPASNFQQATAKEELTSSHKTSKNDKKWMAIVDTFKNLSIPIKKKIKEDNVF